MLSPKIYDFLRGVDERNGRISPINNNVRRVRTLEEIHKEINRAKVSVRDLNPKYNKGIRFVSPRSNARADEDSTESFMIKNPAEISKYLKPNNSLENALKLHKRIVRRDVILKREVFKNHYI